MTLVSDALRYLQQYLQKIVGAAVLIALLLSSGCSKPQASTSRETASPSIFASRPTIKQVETPDLIRELTPWLDVYAPQVHIRQPQAGQVLSDTSVSISLDVQDLPIHKDDVWDMGPHVELLLDNQPYDSIYDISEPLVLKDLAPGTHTLRAFAMRPWDESFKNEGAYDQLTFHVFSKTDENTPVAKQPVLTYGAPLGIYGAQPVLLDFYLTDAPLHEVAQDNPAISDWQIRYTINGESLILKEWEPLYVEGLKPGNNWVQLTLIDDDDNPIQGVFNNTVRLIEYDPDLNDSLAKIVRGEVTFEEIGGIINPTYEPPIPEMPAEPIAQPEATTEPGQDDESVSPEVIDSEVAEPEPADIDEVESLESESSDSEEVETQAVNDSSQDVTLEQSPAQPSDELPQSGKSLDNPQSLETELEVPSESTNDQKIDVNEPSLDLGSEPEVDSSSTSAEEEDAISPVSDDVSDSLITEPADDALEEDALEEDVSEGENSSDEITESLEADPADESTSSNRRYLKRLYDYRQRSMETYGQERN